MQPLEFPRGETMARDISLSKKISCGVQKVWVIPENLRRE
jgi:hypothetical protein